MIYIANLVVVMFRMRFIEGPCTWHVNQITAAGARQHCEVLRALVVMS